MAIEIGMKGEVQSFVEREDTAAEVGSGTCWFMPPPAWWR